jgi:hypothetical protein
VKETTHNKPIAILNGRSALINANFIDLCGKNGIFGEIFDTELNDSLHEAQ